MADPTYITFLTVEDALLLGLVIVERTCFAVVLRKFLLAVDARSRLWLLFPAARALDMRDLVSVKLVGALGVGHVVIHRLVVADPARPVLSFANWVRALQLASPQIVLAAKVSLLELNVLACNIGHRFIRPCIEVFTTLISGLGLL